jgi:LmbE family N-acetylglucosaminyl deacetylase
VKHLFISPHLDDAVFSCADLIARCDDTSVLTVFAGRPPTSSRLTKWDRLSGFVEGDDVIGIRRQEDRRALSVLGAKAIWLSFCDSQYELKHTLSEISQALDRFIGSRAPDNIIFPLGLFHSDHVLTSEACLRSVVGLSGCQWIVYEDALYRSIENLSAQRIEYFLKIGLRLGRIDYVASASGASLLKIEAMKCYRSQLIALNTPGHLGYQDALEAERYYQLIAQ